MGMGATLSSTSRISLRSRISRGAQTETCTSLNDGRVSTRTRFEYVVTIDDSDDVDQIVDGQAGN